MSKWNIYDHQIKAEFLLCPHTTPTNISRKLLNSTAPRQEDPQVEDFARYIRRHSKRILDTYEGSYNATESLDIDNTTVKHMWVKNKEASLFVKNPNFIPQNEEIKDAEKEIDFLSIFKDKITPIKFYFDSNSLPYVANGCLFDRAVYTDTHVAMDVDKDGFALYEGAWNEEEIFKTLTIFVNEVFKNQKSDTLLLHDLGDLMDGWDGYTTRGGHKLPQNMDNQKAFDVALLFKIRMADALLTKYNKIEIVNICNDNHGGAFGYVVNSAFKTYMELKYPDNVTVINQRKFIDHYIKENKCFILTHGKDDKSLKFGFKPKLDPIQIEKIKNYIDEYKLWQYDIEFSKGDSHQLLFDSTSSTAFEYQNFGAISPPSDWVKTNFKNTLRCFTTFNYYEKQKSQHNYIF